MSQALRSVWPLFRDQDYSSKVIILVSDGGATDENPRPLAQALRNAGGTIFACLLTATSIKEPRQLYSPNKFNRRWSAMFNMASTVSCNSKPVQVLRCRGWKIPTIGKCKLFIQAGNPTIIDEFTSASRQFGTSSDALAEIIGQISLDDAAEATNQGSRSICWAHATGSVIHLARSRIVGRTVSEFLHIRSQLLNYFGDNDNGQYVNTVLKEVCPAYKLRYRECDEEGARAATHARRPVIATFWLDANHWDQLTIFYKYHPKRTLSAQNMRAPIREQEGSGHAVVLVRCDERSLTFMNSWGPSFANNGFFTVDCPSTLEITGGPPMRFYDVYWTTDDLTPEEIKSWKDHEINPVQRLVGALPKSFHTLPVVCPPCTQSAPANNYDGTWYEARCRNCNENFKPTAWALLQSLYATQYNTLI